MMEVLPQDVQEHGQQRRLDVIRRPHRVVIHRHPQEVRRVLEEGEEECRVILIVGREERGEESLEGREDCILCLVA